MSDCVLVQGRRVRRCREVVSQVEARGRMIRPCYWSEILMLQYTFYGVPRMQVMCPLVAIIGSQAMRQAKSSAVDE
jgi:hypothetical protein